MLQVVLVEIRNMRVQGVIVKIDVSLGIAGRQPGLLHGHIDIVLVGRQVPTFRLLHPVVPVVRDRANKFLNRN